MNNSEYNKTEDVSNDIVDVPYYTRQLCKDSKYRIVKRNINMENVLRYRREISSVQVDNSFFMNETLQKNFKNSIKIMK